MPQKILALVDDLFFSEKIRATSKSCGIPVHILDSSAELLRETEANPTGLVIIDLNGHNTQPFESIKAIRSKPQLKGVSLLGFFSHVQMELKEKALEAGCDRILPRSAFSQDLAKILKDSSQ